MSKDRVAHLGGWSRGPVELVVAVKRVPKPGLPGVLHKAQLRLWVTRPAHTYTSVHRTLGLSPSCHQNTGMYAGGAAMRRDSKQTCSPLCIGMVFDGQDLGEQHFLQQLFSTTSWVTALICLQDLQYMTAGEGPAGRPPESDPDA